MVRVKMMMARMSMKMVMIRKRLEVGDDEINKYEDSPQDSSATRIPTSYPAVLADDYTDTFIIKLKEGSLLIGVKIDVVRIVVKIVVKIGVKVGVKICVKIGCQDCCQDFCHCIT